MSFKELEMTDDEMENTVKNFFTGNKEVNLLFEKFHINLNKDFITLTGAFKEYLIKKKANEEFRFDETKDLIKMCRMVMSVLYYNYLEHVRDYIKMLSKPDDTFEVDKKDMH